MYPAPCQCRCTYCGFNSRGDTRYIKTPEIETGYNKLFDMLDYFESRGLIAKNAVWQVSTGEITIHPYKSRIYNLIKDRKTQFRTNCFLFDADIAKNLATNPESTINLSLDSGTPETWHKIKRHDNFYTVTDNLVEYCTNGARPGQIELKYIILNGVNDNLTDYYSLVEIMKILGVPSLIISREMSTKYSNDAQEFKNLIVAAANLVAVLKKNGKSYIFHHGFFNEESCLITKLADEMLLSNKI